MFLCLCLFAIKFVSLQLILHKHFGNEYAYIIHLFGSSTFEDKNTYKLNNCETVAKSKNIFEHINGFSVLN